ncbi:MAG: hypothetical protein D3908_03215 [Candidatus Electrothrix sp. AUS4]|nr:hypothetical protein [Candidatus Electrothrix sp. AUS4]
MLDYEIIMKELIALIRGRIFTLKVKLLNKNITTGKNLKLFCKLWISGPGKITIGDNCTVRGIPGSRTQFVSLGTNSPEAELQIGDSVQLLAAKISCKFSISIGNNVIIEDSSIMDTNFHSLDISRRTPKNESRTNCAIIIADNVCIGVRSVINKGVTLGEGAMIAPCSVIQHSFPAHSTLQGNPATLIE